jgi:hypothetical protein
MHIRTKWLEGGFVFGPVYIYTVDDLLLEPDHAPEASPVRFQQ